MKRKSEYHNDHIEKRHLCDKVKKRNVNYQLYKPFKKIILSNIITEFFIRYADDGIV